jgi:hypothetical protein
MTALCLLVAVQQTVEILLPFLKAPNLLRRLGLVPSLEEMGYTVSDLGNFFAKRLVRFSGRVCPARVCIGVSGVGTMYCAVWWWRIPSCTSLHFSNQPLFIRASVLFRMLKSRACTVKSKSAECVSSYTQWTESSDASIMQQCTALIFFCS